MTLNGSTSFTLTLPRFTHCNNLREQIADNLIREKKASGESVNEQTLRADLKLVYKGKPIDLAALGSSPIGDHFDDGDRLHIVLK